MERLAFRKVVPGSGGAGVDSLLGGDGADTFRYGAGEFVANETVDGGNQNDTIVLTSDAQTVGAAAFANKSNLEAFTTANGINSVTMDSTVTASFSAVTVTVTGGTADDTINLAGFGRSVSIVAGTGNNVLTGTGQADTITSGVGNDTIIGGLGIDDINADAGTNKFKFIEALSGDTIRNLAVGTNSFHFDASDTTIDVSGLTTAAAGDIRGADGSALNAADYFESATGFGAKGVDLSGREVLVINQSVGTYASADLAIAGLNAANTGGTDNTAVVAKGGTAAIVIYATAADTYVMAYDSNGTGAAGETKIADVVGITGANLDGIFSQANFFFGA